MKLKGVKHYRVRLFLNIGGSWITELDQNTIADDGDHAMAKIHIEWDFAKACHPRLQGILIIANELADVEI